MRCLHNLPSSSHTLPHNVVHIIFCFSLQQEKQVFDHDPDSLVDRNPREPAPVLVHQSSSRPLPSVSQRCCLADSISSLSMSSPPSFHRTQCSICRNVAVRKIVLHDHYPGGHPWIHHLCQEWLRMEEARDRITSTIKTKFVAQAARFVNKTLRSRFLRPDKVRAFAMQHHEPSQH